MKPGTREWVDKAEADFLSAGREYRARKRPNYDAACFFAQQCVEKYLKARLVEASLSFPRTHDLEALLEIALRVQPLWEILRPALSGLTSYAVAFRYPGDSATRDMARIAVRDASLARHRIRRDMGLRI
jgi:HEPN domain-containing protein